MTFFEFLDACDLKLHFTRLANQSWHVNIDRCDVMEEGMLVGVTGFGDTMGEALKEYVSKVTGKRIAIDAGLKDHRREYVVPRGLALPPLEAFGGGA